MAKEKQQKLKTAKLEKAKHLDYFNIAISVDCVIFGFEERKLKVLLIKCDLKEFKGMWSLLGDLVNPNEDLDNAPYRVLKRRTGLEKVYLEQIGSFGALKRHPSGRVITTAYQALVNVADHRIKITDNEIHWHNVSDIQKLAFDHKQILDFALQGLQKKIMHQPLIFNLLASKFALRDVQLIYESILGKELDRRNFRKKIMQKNWIHSLEEIEKNVSHRPGMLYKLKPGLQ